MKKRKTLITIKKKPVQPIRKTEIYTYNLDDYPTTNSSLEDVINWAKGFGVNFKDVKYERYYDMYDSQGTPRFYLKAPEDLANYNGRLQKYNIDLNKYNAWYNKNKALIDQEMQLRKADEIKQQAAQKVRLKNQAEKDKKALEQKIKNMQKELEKLNGTKP